MTSRLKRGDIANSRGWVVKIGSSLVTNKGQGLDTEFINSLVDQIVALLDTGIGVCVVSSGAIAVGRQKLGIIPKQISQWQAAAAVGQTGLVEQFGRSFTRYQRNIAQILLTHEDLADRQRYLNARTTMRSLLSMGVVPIINENDTVTTNEIKFGDNDTLAGLVCNLIEADLLVLLTDQQGLYSADPSVDADAEFIDEINCDDPKLDIFAGKSRSDIGKGGMVTKVRSAKRAARSGATTIIASGANKKILDQIYRGEQIGSLIQASLAPMNARHQWLAGQLRTKGSVQLDLGATNAILTKGVSLLPVGVCACTGLFQRGDLVDCLDNTGKCIARGLINYGYQETHKILGADSRKIEQMLGHIIEPELIHRDNMVLV